MDNSSRVFGDYQIKRKLGAGGMASVFLAVHNSNEEEVALKILHEHYSDDLHVRKRFEHEARIVMRLKHPRIVPILDYSQADNRPYLVMPYYSGGSLASFFSKPRSVKHESTLKLLHLLADGLDYAHSQEVVHRDFKLENILIAADGLPAISDFGIAQSAHTTRITVTGQILGTPQYLAPENLDTDSKLNYRADLYALAVMAYLMLTGYFPFSALDPLKLAIMHRTEYPPAPNKVNPNLPSSLNPVLERGLAKNPADRYPTAATFVEALEDAFEYAALVTTRIFMNTANPVPPTQPDLSQALKTPPFSALHEIEHETIPAVMPAALPPKRKRSLSTAYLLVLLIAGVGMAFFVLNNGLNFSNTSSNPEKTVEALLNANLANTARAAENQNPGMLGNRTSPIVLLSETATITVQASLSPSPQATNTASNSPAPTTVPATATNPPAPTTVPPTNPPADGGAVIATAVEPIVNPVRTAIPCVPVPLVRDC